MREGDWPSVTHFRKNVRCGGGGQPSDPPPRHRRLNGGGGGIGSMVADAETLAFSGIHFCLAAKWHWGGDLNRSLNPTCCWAQQQTGKTQTPSAPFRVAAQVWVRLKHQSIIKLPVPVERLQNDPRMTPNTAALGLL